MASTRYYKMRAKDGNAAELTWRYWTVTGQPDGDGRYYEGPFVGSKPNLQEVVVASQWEVPV
jgi:hypothetical protein